MEPIAIVGIGCRFPGDVSSPEDLWNLLKEGKDAIQDIPGNRFGNIEELYDPKPGVPGKIVARQGGYLKDIDKFDPAFFDIAPKEATYIDPQQRLLLEVAWEALEDANQVIDEKLKTRTGVFVGVWTSDYETYMYSTGVPINLYMTTGGSRYAASGRLSYALDARGPSLTIDTACSSSLVALHLACRSLQSGECSLALVGGANLIIQPHITLGYSRSKMLSPESRCKFGDEQANGYVRSEGVAVVLLKRLSQALEEHNTIYAVIEGSAVNNDGQGSGSLVAPSLDGQIALLREAYRVAGISPGQVQYVEAHGTGTRAGDHVELKALGAVLSEGREPQKLCRVGSIKTNLGHTEAASGLAGLIKVALCLKHRAIPASLHMQNPSARIPWHELPLTMQQTFENLKPGNEDIYAAVNSFGITGTNAHVILRNAPVASVCLSARSQERFPHAALLPLSAHSPAALRALATRYRDFLLTVKDETTLSFYDICHAASLGRKHLKHRLALIAHTKKDALEQLQAFIVGKSFDDTICGQAASTTQPVLVCGGYHPRWFARGRELLAQEPVFRETFMQCNEYLRKYTQWSLLERLSSYQDDPQAPESGVARSIIFALQVACIALWKTWGIAPTKVVGYDLGQVTAAYVAGEIGLEEALRQVSMGGRSRQERTLPRYTASSSASPGEEQSLEDLLYSPLYPRVARSNLLNYAVYPHALREGRAYKLTEALVPASSSTAVMAVNPSTLERMPDGPSPLLEPALFGESIDTLIESGHTLFVEVGPSSDLSKVIRCRLEEHEKAGTVLAWFTEKGDKQTATLHLLRSLYLQGSSVAWGNLYQKPGNSVRLPTYPWQRERFWLEEKSVGN
ncbi:MAG TPA: type I polyketide synthase [Ktedonobacteraceae bacterium]|nr:type I polyketide synthase [Ktedonobacteraceae bacterium]